MSLCPQCGSPKDGIVVAEGQMRCPECGLGSSFAPLTMRSAVDPAEDDFWARAARKQRGHAERLRNAPKRPTFPVHALDSRWTGMRSLGGWGFSGDQMVHFELTHGDSPWDEKTPQIRVVTRVPGPMDTLDGVGAMLASDQVESFWERTGRLDDAVRHAAFPRDYTSADPTAP